MLWGETWQEEGNRWAMEIRTGTVRGDLEFLAVEPWVMVMPSANENRDHQGGVETVHGVEELGKGFLKLKFVAGGKEKEGLGCQWGESTQRTVDKRVQDC